MPGTQAPTSLPHGPPTGKPSSITPSQSSSTPLQTSGLLLTPFLQINAPSLHSVIPPWHAPVASPQGWPPSGFISSTIVSQSSSRPLHSSSLLVFSPVQTRLPDWHFSTPNSHAPSSVAPQAPPPSGLPSSKRPSQSSSSVLQSSSVPSTAVQPCHAPRSQTSTPTWHSPTSVPHACDNISSTLPSQSLS